MNTEKDINQVAEYNPFLAERAQLLEKYKGLVYDVTLPEQYANAELERKAFVNLNNRIEKERVKIKAPVLELTRQIDAQAKTITDALTSRITELKTLIDAENDRQALIDAELNKRIADIRATPMLMAGRSSDDMNEAQQGLMDLNTKDFDVYSVAAQNAINDALKQLEPMIAMQVNNELTARKQAEQQAVLDARQAEMDKVAADLLNKANEAKRQSDLEAARLQGIEQAQRDAQLAIETEIANKMKLDALKPDQDKFLYWLDRAIDTAPTLADTALNDRVLSIRNRLIAVVNELS